VSKKFQPGERVVVSFINYAYETTIVCQHPNEVDWFVESDGKEGLGANASYLWSEDYIVPLEQPVSGLRWERMKSPNGEHYCRIEIEGEDRSYVNIESPLCDTEEEAEREMVELLDSLVETLKSE